MATISTPSNFALARVEGKYLHSTKMVINPYNGVQQVAAWGTKANKLKFLNITNPAQDDLTADEWTEFFEDLNGHENVFEISAAQMGDIYPHETFGGPVEFRLLNPEDVWDLSPPLIYQFSFQAVEVR